MAAPGEGAGGARQRAAVPLPRSGASGPRRAAAQVGAERGRPRGGGSAGGKRRGDAVSRRGRRRVPLGCANSTQPGFISGFALLLCRQRSGMGLHVLIISHRRPSAASSSAAGPGGQEGLSSPQASVPSHRQGPVARLQKESYRCRRCHKMWCYLGVLLDPWSRLQGPELLLKMLSYYAGPVHLPSFSLPICFQ